MERLSELGVAGTQRRGESFYSVIILKHESSVLCVMGMGLFI